MSADTTPAVTVESVEAHLRARNNGDLPTCPRCEEAPVRIQEADLPSDEPTGRVGSLLGQPVHLRRAVIVVCRDEENCAGPGIEITGPPDPAGTGAELNAQPQGSLLDSLPLPPNTHPENQSSANAALADADGDVTEERQP